MTRAKSAALGGASATEASKKSLQTKKSTTALGTNGAAATRKRAALGDVSNVAKADGLGAGAKEGKELKKPTASKGLVSKAAHPTKVTKSTKTTTRPALASKEKNASAEKRPAPGSGIGGTTKKPRKAAAVPALKEEDAENIVPQPTEEPQEVATKELPAKEAPAKFKPIEQDPALDDEVPDLDREDQDDPLMVSEYVVEIFEYLKELEISTMANANYMDNQNELEWKMRGILVDWLLEVHTRFRLLPETLFLAVNIIDRFLSTKVVQLDRLQLVGVTAMFIASKYEEVLSPHVQNFRHVADDGFTEEEILSAERFVLAALNYDLSYPNPMNFLRRISKADNYDIQTRTLGKYLLEISCLDHRFIEHPPSQVAAAAMYLARMVLQRGEWVSNMVFSRLHTLTLYRMPPSPTMPATPKRRSSLFWSS